MTHEWITSERGKEMLTYLPRYYETSRIMKSVLQAQGKEVDKLRHALEEILGQFFVSTATWGLDRWEEELGIPLDQDKPITERRSYIQSRLRGVGTATVRLVKEVANSYDYGAIDVLEDYPAFTVIIKFVDRFGIPPNIEDMKTVLREIVPAHLVLLYEYNYFLWSELDYEKWTWDELDSLNLTWDQLEVYK